MISKSKDSESTDFIGDYPINIFPSHNFNKYSHAIPIFKNKRPFFNFCIIGDRTGNPNDVIFKKVINTVRAMQPDFVICIGDLINGYSKSKKKINKEWNSLFGDLAEVHQPIFLVPGNHDISNSIMEGIWLEKFGVTHYSFRFNNSLFLIMNSEDPPYEGEIEEWLNIKKIFHINPKFASNILDKKYPSKISLGQIDYIQKKLNENSDADWVYVFMHKPIWKNNINGFNFIEETLNDFNFTIFSGHKHRFKVNSNHLKNYIEIGSSGGGLHSNGATEGEYYQITWVSYSPGNSPIVTSIDINGIKYISDNL